MHHKLQMLTFGRYYSKPKRACEPCKVRRSPRKRLSPAPDDRREAISDEDDQDRQSTTNNEVNDTRSFETYSYTCLSNVLLSEMAIRTRLSYSFVPREDFFSSTIFIHIRLQNLLDFVYATSVLLKFFSLIFSLCLHARFIAIRYVCQKLQVVLGQRNARVLLSLSSPASRASHNEDHAGIRQGG